MQSSNLKFWNQNLLISSLQYLHQHAIMLFAKEQWLVLTITSGNRCSALFTVQICRCHFYERQKQQFLFTEHSMNQRPYVRSTVSLKWVRPVLALAFVFTLPCNRLSHFILVLMWQTEEATNYISLVKFIHVADRDRKCQSKIWKEYRNVNEMANEIQRTQKSLKQFTAHLKHRKLWRIISNFLCGEMKSEKKTRHRIQSEHIYSLIYKSKRQTVCAII